MTPPTPPDPKRGEIWRIDLEPTRGDEIRKSRPAVVVSAFTNDPSSRPPALVSPSPAPRAAPRPSREADSTPPAIAAAPGAAGSPGAGPSGRGTRPAAPSPARAGRPPRTWASG